MSLSMRRAWIEMRILLVRVGGVVVALHAESVDRNLYSTEDQQTAKSLSMRRAWIEIISECDKRQLPDVALHAESVDRNADTFGARGWRRRRSPCGERG